MLETNREEVAVQELSKVVKTLDGVKPGSDNQDLGFLHAVVGDATVIGLGEITHGISDIFQMKHRLIEFLVQHKGFTIFAIEANMPEACLINEYVLHGKGDLRELIEGMHFWTWNNQDIFNLIEFFREYNKTATQKIQFTGFDGQDLHMPAEIVSRYAAKEVIHAKVDNILELLKDLNHQYYEHCNFDKAELLQIIPVIKKDARYVTAGEQLAELEKFFAEQPANAEQEWAKQNLQQLKSTWIGLGTNPVAQREKLMADNVLWIQQQNPDQKIILWAHNAHIHKLHVESDWHEHEDCGEILAKTLQDKYQAMGFVVYEGTYAALDQDDKYKLKRDLVLSTPAQDTLESKLHAVALAQSNPDPVLFLNLNDPATPAWLREPVKARTVTLGSIKEFPAYSFQATILVGAYDSLIYIGNTHAAQPIKAPEKISEASQAFESSLFKPAEKSVSSAVTDKSSVLKP
jgi:erythromycin esterase